MDPRRHSTQPGLEVAPTDMPEVIQGPTIEKPEEHQVQGYSYDQTTAAYPPSSQPAYGWDASQSGAYTAGPPSEPPRKGRILGLEKKMFFLIFGPLLALLVIGLAVGLGVGLGLRKQGSGATSTPTSAPATSIHCPASNDTTYDSGGTTYSIMCSIDYNSQNGTVEDTNAVTSTAEDCMAACDARTTCVAAGWGTFEGQSTCWMKRSLALPQEASPGWVFVTKE